MLAQRKKSARLAENRMCSQQDINTVDPQSQGFAAQWKIVLAQQKIACARSKL